MSFNIDRKRVNLSADANARLRWIRGAAAARILAAASAVVFLFVSAACGAGKPGTPSMQSFTSSLDERVPQLMQRHNIPGVTMALIQDGEPVWSAAYGYADLERKQPMQVDAVCRAESISKSVTAWGVMNLVEEGRLELDAPVHEYLEGWQLPETRFDEEDVTIRRLLSNSAGMPLGTIGEEYEPLGAMPSLEEYLTREAVLQRSPGEMFEYSNPGFNLLELVVENVTGESFANYMEDEVLAPLGMEHASYEWDEAIRPLLPLGYDLQGGPVPPYVYPASASGGLFATVEDVARFAAAGMAANAVDQDVLSRSSIREIHSPQVEIPGMFGMVAEEYGFGHFLETLPDGRTAAWHGGQGHGWMTHFHVVPETGDGIVIFTNSQRSWPLIARVLRMWGRWSGVGIVHFGVITTATVVFEVLTALLLAFCVWMTIRLIMGLRTGTREFRPLSQRQRLPRVLLALGAAGIAAGLAWAAAQPYLFVSSIFPGAVRPAVYVLEFLAVVCAAAACLPRKGGRVSPTPSAR